MKHSTQTVVNIAIAIIVMSAFWAILMTLLIRQGARIHDPEDSHTAPADELRADTDQAVLNLDAAINNLEKSTESLRQLEQCLQQARETRGVPPPGPWDYETAADQLQRQLTYNLDVTECNGLPEIACSIDPVAGSNGRYILSCRSVATTPDRR